MAENNFEDFFNLDKSVESVVKEPSMEEVINGLIEMTAERPLFYMNHKLRMFVCTAIAFCNNKMMEFKQKGETAPIGLSHAAFMMLLSDTMSITYDEHAGEMERQMFPHNREDYVENAIEKYGDPNDPF